MDWRWRLLVLRELTLIAYWRGPCINGEKVAWLTRQTRTA